MSLKGVRTFLRKKRAYTRDSENSLQSVVRTRLMAFYQASFTPGIVSESLQQEVIESFHLSTTQIESDEQIEIYYQNQFELMMARNQILL